MFLYVCIRGSANDPYNALSYASIGASFLLSLIFVRKSPKKILITLALGINVVADYFLVLMPSEQNRLIGVCIFLGVQFAYFLYTMFLVKGIGLKIVWIAIRVALCLLAGFLVPLWLKLDTLEMISLIYIVNSFVTLATIAFHLRFEWLTFVGYFLFFACDIFVGLTYGAGLLGITGTFLNILLNYDIAFFLYVPGIFIIALSSVWEFKNWWKE